MINDLDTVVLTDDLPQHGLSAGDLGTVVLVHGTRGYEVEFVALDGATIGVVSLGIEQVRSIGSNEIAHARKLQSQS